MLPTINHASALSRRCCDQTNSMLCKCQQTPNGRIGKWRRKSVDQPKASDWIFGKYVGISKYAANAVKPGFTRFLKGGTTPENVLRICLQEDLEHRLRVRDLPAAILNHALFKRLRPWWLFFTLAAALDRSVRCAFAAIYLRELAVQSVQTDVHVRGRKS